MSEELERVHTINLGKVLLSQPQHRAVRALNMIREFARRHMKTQNVKIDEDLARHVWSRGARSPPRKIRVRMHRTDMGHILVSGYDGPLEAEQTTTAAADKELDAKGAPAAAAAVTGAAAEPKEIPSLPEPGQGTTGDVTGDAATAADNNDDDNAKTPGAEQAGGTGVAVADNDTDSTAAPQPGSGDADAHGRPNADEAQGAVADNDTDSKSDTADGHAADGDSDSHDAGDGTASPPPPPPSDNAQDPPPETRTDADAK